MRNGRHWYAAAIGLVGVAHVVLPGNLRAYSYVVSVAMALPCLILVLRRTRRGSRLPWWLLLGGMTSLATGNALMPYTSLTPVEILVNAGHVTMLAAATLLAFRRGRGDIGGLLDVSVAAIALAGMFWAIGLGPRVHELGSRLSDQISLLGSIMMLSGVLGAMVRLWYTDRRLRRLRALRVFQLGLAAGLVGVVLEAWTFGTLSASGRDGLVDTVCMVSYGLVGLAVLEPSVRELNRPGPAAVDHLSGGRLFLHGAVVVSGPLVVGIRAMLGMPIDGPLLAFGTLLITPLVMVRVGRLAAQQARAERELRHRATHDLLTALPNRAELLDRLTGALERERAAGRPSVVLLFCDLNGFKQVNDRLGHVAGDQLLTELGARLSTGLRAGDTVARYGGDEFLLLCEDDDQPAAVARLTTHVEQALARPFRLAGEQLTIGTSTGAVISDGVLGPDELISRADAAMYRAKESIRARRGLAVP